MLAVQSISTRTNFTPRPHVLLLRGAIRDLRSALESGLPHETCSHIIAQKDIWRFLELKSRSMELVA